MRTAVAALAVGLIVFLSGCGYQDFKRPTMRNYLGGAFDKREKPFEIAKTNVVRDKQMAAIRSRWQQMASGVKDEYAVGPGDVLKTLVCVPSQPTSNISMDLAVGNDGAIECPLVGRVDVRGLGASAIAEKLSKLYADGFFKSPLVNVTVGEYHSKLIFVSGCVTKPGVIALRSNRTTLLEAILAADGVTVDAGESVLVTRMGASDGRTNPESVTINLESLLSRSGVDQNMWVLPGDVITIPRKIPRYFYVLGYVNTPGAYPMPKEGVVDMMEAIAYARGITDSARAENTYLVRKTPQGEKRYQIDLTSVASGAEPDVHVYPEDRIIVGTSGVRRFLDGFLRGMGFRSLAPAF